MLIHACMWSPFVSRFFDSACLSLLHCLSQTKISLSSSCLFSLLIYNIRAIGFFFVAALMACEDCLIFSHERRKTITLSKDERAGITSGEFMVIFCTSSSSHPQIRRLCSHLICYSWCLGNMRFSIVLHVAAGCYQDHRQRHIIIRGEYLHPSCFCSLFG